MYNGPRNRNFGVVPTAAQPHVCSLKPLCDKPIRRNRLMCGEHWKACPQELRDAVIAAYRTGQEVSGSGVTASQEYRQACRDATAAVRATIAAEAPLEGAEARQQRLKERFHQQQGVIVRSDFELGDGEGPGISENAAHRGYGRKMAQHLQENGLI